ncbi:MULTISPECIES: efflux RND transporter periplasmic adaptor subunit [Vibrio]|uniref:efflux RND transporter periplasmic adaptor subunit n=1 Tax=Vibrio TaxID=662 RepID=UPI0020751A00|nr:MULTISPECIES: efflux RND transporter periplasmic adaptor subunit [Vibrio]USD34541.1 efflux RND transporter periplasmic adaptor subunit [Vibrio sp. SCSIO 43186]USD47609.1 efflux RND transporter periplasmic adaptor subunit [Vibrio sp. SCSIO 43145]USD71666.1 efflux RND transporter periplasmic adaptor subunit [Vibrio sp. SCSIO 43139]USD98569.1 efflux transporter periplasmic adaptor subunit [Vibrio coralliilyticus]
MKTLQIAAIALLVGGALGYSANHFLAGSSMGMDAKAESDSAEPLYWVAPMDPNYKRDKPGKSPMGMDLIPVYAEDMAGEQDEPGTITIDPSVENNLGVKSEPVTLEPLSPRIETVGYIAFDESQLWQTNVRVAGWVEKLFINAIGEKVNKGDVLFTLYSPELVKAQEELLNASRTGRTGLVKGATERLVTLGVDRAQIKAILKRGKASQNIEIKAPANGVIASLSIREGGYLSPAQAVISAGPLNNVWVDAEVFERQAQWIKAGSEASMTLDAIPGNEWQGKVDYVYPILDPNTRTLRVRLKFPNPDGELKPNMFANIALQPVSEESVLTIPKSAVIRSGGMARIVLAEGQGKYRSARIETGREAGDRVEVLQGLTQDDQVVTSAHFMLDSESSQSADLARINGVEPDEETVWAKGEITDVMADHGMLTINHQPVPEWDWPGMVMNFTLAKDVDASAFTTGQSIEFEMQKTESGQYEIVDYKVDDSVVAGELWLQGDISMLMADFGMITLNHLPVAEWNWQAGEMNFSVGDEVDLSGFEEGQRVRFLVERQGADYLLKQLATDEG